MARERAELRILIAEGACDHVHGHQLHLMPAPRERAIVANSDTTMVKRARFAFTTPPLVMGAR
jgi:hypothetical protein